MYIYLYLSLSIYVHIYIYICIYVYIYIHTLADLLLEVLLEHGDDGDDAAGLALSYHMILYDIILHYSIVQCGIV